MRLDSLHRLNIARRRRIAAALVTNLETHDEIVVLEGDRLEGSFVDLVSSGFRSGCSKAFDGPEGKVFFNVYLPAPRIVIIGAVHISQYLTPMARIAGFDVRIIDPRTAFAIGDRFPDCAVRADWPSDALMDDPLDRYTALVALTHDPKIDDFPLAAAVRTGCFYIGALGSRKTHTARIARLTADGLAPDLLSAIHAPIGLDIGATTPAEIAVAILAEIIAALRSGPLALIGDSSP
jgi:xanthine dehydrogenase accessory factor